MRDNQKRVREFLDVGIGHLRENLMKVPEHRMGFIVPKNFKSFLIIHTILQNSILKRIIVKIIG